MLLGEKGRPETGPMEFEDDWRGVFIRGDNAIAYGMALQHLVAGISDPVVKGQMQSLVGLLHSSHQQLEAKAQKMKAFNECLQEG